MGRGAARENCEKVNVGHLTDILKRVDRAAVEAIYPTVWDFWCEGEIKSTSSYSMCWVTIRFNFLISFLHTSYPSYNNFSSSKYRLISANFSHPFSCIGCASRVRILTLPPSIKNINLFKMCTKISKLLIYISSYTI